MYKITERETKMKLTQLLCVAISICYLAGCVKKEDNSVTNQACETIIEVVKGSNYVPFDSLIALVPRSFPIFEEDIPEIIELHSPDDVDKLYDDPHTYPNEAEYEKPSNRSNPYESIEVPESFEDYPIEPCDIPDWYYDSIYPIPAHCKAIIAKAVTVTESGEIDADDNSVDISIVLDTCNDMLDRNDNDIVEPDSTAQLDANV